jgi:hypothetical protein
MASMVAREGTRRCSTQAHSAVHSGNRLKASSASATGSRATAEYRHTLCTATSRPISGITRRCRDVSVRGTCCSHTSNATKTAVTPLRTATAVTTSSP